MLNIKRSPKQKIPDKQKTEKWGIDNIKYFCDVAFTDLHTIRKRKKDMNDNYNMIIGKLDNNRLNKQLNPLQLEGNLISYPTLSDNVISIINPAINTLLGEEFKRNLEWKTFVVNQEAISKKEEMIKETIISELASLLDVQNTKEEELEEKLKKLEDWKEYEAQDVRERRANQLLNYYWEQLKLRYVFNEGFLDVLAVAEEVYRIDIVGKEPRVTRCNPLDIYTIRSATSQFIEASDAVIEDSYLSYGQIVDEFGSILTERQLGKLVDNSADDSQSTGGIFAAPFLALNRDTEANIGDLFMNDVRETQGGDGVYRRSYRNNFGDWRVTRVCWKSLREVAILTTIDELTGEELEFILDGEIKYEPDINKGEKLKYTWITEWWQGVRIGNDEFIDIKPCPIQRRDINNPYISYPPYVGTIYNTNDRPARSLLDELKPIQEEWTIHKKRAEMLWARNLGKLVRIDISKIPSLKGGKKDLDLFMSWLYQFGIILENPFEEGARGQNAGQYQSTVSAVDAELATSIAQTINYLNFLKDLADEVGGISKQRRGDGSASEGLGVTQERIVRSTHQTERLFAKHDYCKVRVLEALLETSKYCMENGNKKAQFILDDISIALFNIDAEEFKDADYGIKIVNTSKVAELYQDMDKYAEYALNNGTPISEILSIKMSSNMSDKIRKLQKLEKERQQREEQMQQQQQQTIQQVEQMKQQAMQAQMQHEAQMKQFEWEMRLKIEQMKIEAGAYQQYQQAILDENKNGIDDNVEIEKQRMANEVKQKELALKEKLDKETMSIMIRENEKDRQNKLELERIKAKNKSTITKK